MTKIKADFDSFSSVANLLNLLGTTENELEQIIRGGYRHFNKIKDGKARKIEAPNPQLKLIQQKLLKYLQDRLACPQYCMAGFKGQNNIKNAQKHRFKREVWTMDIIHYYQNTREKYIRQFFEKNLGVKKEVADILVKLTTHKNHLPTGAPTSTLLSCFVHQEIFDSIYKKMQSLEIDMTVYIDDITLSTHKHIEHWVIKYINNALKTHGLHLKKSKTKRYGYKHAVVTGVHINQCGKMTPPFAIGHSVVETLRNKEIKDMTMTELRAFIAKISYIQQFKPKNLIVSKNKAIKQLKKIYKENNQ